MPELNNKQNQKEKKKTKHRISPSSLRIREPSEMERRFWAGPPGNTAYVAGGLSFVPAPSFVFLPGTRR